MHKSVAIAALLGALSSANAQGIDHPNEFGTPDCGTWFKPGLRQINISWLMGFLSGDNVAITATMRTLKSDPLEGLRSGEQAVLWMDNYCKAHPLSDVSQGAQALYNEVWLSGAKNK